VPLPLVSSRRQELLTATVDRGPSIVIAVQPTPSAKVMSHSSGGAIHLDDSDDNVEEVGSDVEEVVAWDHELRGTKTFSTGLLILSGRRFESPNLDEQQKILFSLIDHRHENSHRHFLPHCNAVQS
jgi:hypothetical protein